MVSCCVCKYVQMRDVEDLNTHSTLALSLTASSILVWGISTLEAPVEDDMCKAILGSFERIHNQHTMPVDLCIYICVFMI